MTRRSTMANREGARWAPPALGLMAVAISLPGLVGASPHPLPASSPVIVAVGSPPPGSADFPQPIDATTLPGTTGTVASLPEPVGVTPTALDASIVPARPFSTAGASATDRARALQCLTAAIYYEAASEPENGQRAVAQVVLNRVRHPAFPVTVCGVVYQGSEKAGCQFSFACDGAMARRVSTTAWARAARYAADALAGRVFADVGLATHYHTYTVTPAWNRALVMTDMIGPHLFHRWKGYWGTAAAFGRVYAGGEPMPGPRVPLPAPILPPDPVIASAAALPLAIASPALAATSEPAPTAMPATSDHLPDSPVLDRWKDAGKPLL